MRMPVFLLFVTVGCLNCCTCLGQGEFVRYVTTGDDISNPSDNHTTLREAVEEANAYQGNDAFVIKFVSEVPVVSLTQEEFQGNLSHTIGKPLDIECDVTIEGPVVITHSTNVEYRAFIVHHGAKLTIENITVTGFFTGVDTDEVANDLDKPFFQHGGAVSNWGILTLKEATFDHNHSTNHGGAIYNAAVLEIDDCIFTNNSAGDSTIPLADYQQFGNGGAIYSHDTNLVIGDAVLDITHSTFEGNESFGIRLGGGGAIYNKNHEESGYNEFEEHGATAKLEVSHSYFHLNKALAGSGGAIYTYRAGYDINSSLFVENECATINFADHNPSGPHDPNPFTKRYERGGAIYNFAPTNNWEPGVKTLISSCTFDANKGRFGGAVHFYLDSHAEVKRCTFANNTSVSHGGALVLRSVGFALLEDSTIVRNKIDNDDPYFGRGGGIYSISSQNYPKIYNTIIMENTRNNVDVELDSDYFGLFSADCGYNLVGKPDPKHAGNVPSGIVDNLILGDSTHSSPDTDNLAVVDVLGDNNGPQVGAQASSAILQTCLPVADLEVTAVDSGQSSATSDQRGFPIDELKDKGAVELQDGE